MGPQALKICVLHTLTTQKNTFWSTTERHICKRRKQLVLLKERNKDLVTGRKRLISGEGRKVGSSQFEI